MDRPVLPPGRDERGVALVMALLILLALSLLGVLLMTSISVERKITGFSQRNQQALNVAEAGIGEALARLRFGGDVGAVMDPSNPRRVAQIFLTSAGSVPVLGTDSTGHDTRQPAGAWLDYTTPGRGPDVLTVEFKTDPARTTVYRYDQALNPAVQTVSGLPIYKITSTGRKGSSKVKVVTEVIQKPHMVAVQAALMADVGIDFSGNSQVCGLNHRADTPAGTEVEGGPPRPCQTWEVGSGDLPGGWSSDSVTSAGSGTQVGNPSGYVQNQTGFFAGPWEPLGMSQAEFWSWIGAPMATVPNPPSGIIRLDNNSVTQDHTGDWHINGGNGEGMMYVDGNVHINGNFTYRGLLYIEGDLDINGDCWILGAIVVKGVTRLNIANGSCVILYSHDAITQNISKYGGQFVNLSWREIH